jgi:WD40 repeat protein
MEVIVKNIQISKTHISKMAYNNLNNILACNIDGNDTVLFFALDSQTMTFIELFKGMSKPPGSKISMSWSPDGKYLALAAGNIEIWEFKDGRIKPVKTFQEDFIEIKIIEWSVDSQCYACGGISRTNTIKVRNIETGKMR